MKQTGFILFSALLGNSQKSLLKLKNKKMEGFGLSASHTLCICLLHEHPDGVSKSRLAQLCGVDKAQISRVITELEEAKYVSAVTTASPHRPKYTLSELGRSVAEEIADIIREINDFVSGDISEEELLAFYHTFMHISENLKRAEKRYL